MQMNKVPTLLVGLGGIGCATVDMINSLISKKDKEYIGIVGLDTNMEDLKKLHIKTIRTSDSRLVKEYIMEHPEYREWFPVNRFTVNRGMITGAGQIRSISRLAALAAIEDGRFIVLEEEIKRILKHTGEHDTAAFNVFIVGSITGGTGAGLFLQMPFYIRKLLRQENAINNIRIRGMFLSADITKNVQPSNINRDAVMVNAYACMKELNAFYLTQNREDEENHLSLEFYEKAERKELEKGVRKGLLHSNSEDEYNFFDDVDWEAVQSDVKDIVSDGSNIPYDAFYLIEGTDNQGGIGNISLETVEKQIAKMIYTLLFTPVKAVDDGTLDNAVLSDMEGGGMNRYSSAGMCVVIYPYEQMRNYVTLRWVKDLVKEEWLLIDRLYEIEVREAQSRQKSDPSVVIPKIEEVYTRLFNKETGGGEGSRLGKLRGEAYLDNQEDYNNPICKSASMFHSIDKEIDRIMTQMEVESAKEECAVNMKKLGDLDAADKEVIRVYDELKKLKTIITGIVAKSRYEVANEVFPPSEESLRMKKDSELCIYKILSGAHPVAARFLCYHILNELEKRISRLDSSLSGLDLLAYEDIDFYGNEDDGVQNATEAIAMVRNRVLPVIGTGRKPLRTITSKFQQMTSTQVSLLDEYGRDSLKLSTYKILRERFTQMAAYYEGFFSNIQEKMNQNEVKIGILENSFIENPFGEVAVCALPEDFKSLFGDFRLKAEYELPSETKKAIFAGIFKETCFALESKNKELTEIQKQMRDDTTSKNLSALFEHGVVDTLKTIVIDKGRGIIDMSVKQAIEKEFQLRTGARSDGSAEYEKRRIDYEKALVEKAMRIAVPMFAVKDEKDTTETIYLALNPDSAEMDAGIPDKGVTKERLVPEKCEATDFQPVNVLMEEEFSRYEMICLKAKHKYTVENLAKYDKKSEYAKAYETRINNLGKEPTEEGQDAYKTVVNPHLNRYWHEEGFVPQLLSSERAKSKDDVLKAFVYAMGMDTFSRMKSEELNNRLLWYLNVGSRSIAVRKQGRIIGNSYVDLYDSLYFNRKAKKYILHQAQTMRKNIKGYLDSEEMMDIIMDTWFIEDLIQSGKAEDDQDENFLDILLKMYPNMDRNKWTELFKGLELALFEYLAFMFDDNARHVNEAYKLILNRMYGYCSAGLKEKKKRKRLESGDSISSELELTIAESRLKAQIADLIKHKYI